MLLEKGLFARKKSCWGEITGVGGRRESICPLLSRRLAPPAQCPRAAPCPFVFPSQACPGTCQCPGGGSAAAEEEEAGPGRLPSVRPATSWLQPEVIFRLLRPLPSPFSSACTFTAFEAFICPERTKKINFLAFQILSQTVFLFNSGKIVELWGTSFKYLEQPSLLMKPHFL